MNSDANLDPKKIIKQASRFLYDCNMASTWEWRGNNAKIIDFYAFQVLEAKKLLTSADMTNAALDQVIETLARIRLYPKEIQTDTIKLLHHTVKGIWLDLDRG